MANKRFTLTSSRDPLAVEISAKIKAPKGFKVTTKLIEQAIRWKLEHNLRNPKGFDLKIVSWTNPTRNPEKINPRNGLPLNAPRAYGPDRERWETLRGPLLSATLDIRPLGKAKRR